MHGMLPGCTTGPPADLGGPPLQRERFLAGLSGLLELSPSAAGKQNIDLSQAKCTGRLLPCWFADTRARESRQFPCQSARNLLSSLHVSCILPSQYALQTCASGPPGAPLWVTVEWRPYRGDGPQSRT